MMRDFPKKLYRKTKHRPPRCQVYQPGFNKHNGCWLQGGWVTVPATDFASRAKAHQAMYSKVLKHTSKQSHHDPPVPEMSPPQLQAWQYFSGNNALSIRYKDGCIGRLSTRLCAGKPAQSTLTWLRRLKAKVIPEVLNPDRTITDQREGVPKDLLSSDRQPVPIWKLIVQQNRDLAEKQALFATRPDGPPDNFLHQVAMTYLTELEEAIIRQEIHLDSLETPEDLRQRYTSLRAGLEKNLGPNFQQLYESVRQDHNVCARDILDNSEGRSFACVLPEFQPDGTHQPTGPRDVPWNTEGNL